jgi:hypothetical protein
MVLAGTPLQDNGERFRGTVSQNNAKEYKVDNFASF